MESIINKRLNYSLQYIDNPNVFLQENMHQTHVAFDTETNSLNPFIPDFKVGCVTMTFDGVNGYYLPFDKIDKRLFSRFLKNKYLIGHNYKFDKKALFNCGIQVPSCNDDTLILYHLLNTDRMHNSLKSLAWLIGFGGYDEKLELYKQKNKITNYLNIPEKLLFEYATLDAIVTFRLWKHAIDNLVPQQPNVYKAYQEFVIPVMDVFISMEMGGLDVDLNYLNALNEKYKKKIDILEKQIKDAIGKDILVSSNEQLGLALEEMKLPDYGRTKKGHYKTGIDILKLWKQDGYEIADLLVEYRSLEKLRTNYLGEASTDDVQENLFFDAPSDEPDSEDGIVKNLTGNKLRYNFGVAMTDAWRQFCSRANIQNIPKDKELREMFKMPDDYEFAEIDIAGFHMRLMAEFSEDPTMRDVAINRGGDYHSMTAQSVFARDMTIEEFIQNKGHAPYKDYRQSSKAINFSYLYFGHFSLIMPMIKESWTEDNLDLYIAENELELVEYKNAPDKVATVAKDIHKKFFETYPNIPLYCNREIEKGKRDHYIDNIFGTRRHLPQLAYIPSNMDHDSKKVVKHLENICTNTGILSAEAVMVHRAMRKIYDEFRERNMKSRLVLMVHDSVGVKIYKPERKQVYDICMKHLTYNFNFTVPLEAEMQIGTWGFGDEYFGD